MPEEKGKKFDSDKLRFDLIPPECETMLAAIFTMGAMKYAPDNWKKVDEFNRRYYNAKVRHSNQRRLGEVFDSESGFPHSAHAAWNAIVEMWADIHDHIGQENLMSFINEKLALYKAGLKKD